MIAHYSYWLLYAVLLAVHKRSGECEYLRRERVHPLRVMHLSPTMILIGHPGVLILVPDVSHRWTGRLRGSLVASTVLLDPAGYSVQCYSIVAPGAPSAIRVVLSASTLGTPNDIIMA